MARNRFPTPSRGSATALVLLVLLLGAIFQGACLSHHDAAGLVRDAAVAAPASGHECDTEPHQHRDERVQQPVVSAASVDLAAADAPAVTATATAVVPRVGPEPRPAPAGSDLLARLCVFRI